MTHKRSLLALAHEERTCASLLFCILAIALPGFYGVWRFVTKGSEPSASFAFVLSLRLIVPIVASAVCGYMLWNRRSFLNASSVGAAFVYTGIWFAFIAAWILVFGRVPSKYHHYFAPREQSIPFFVVASIALTIGASTMAVGRATSRQKPNNLWRGP